MSDELDVRIRILEEKFEYQDRTIETLNEVVIGQQQQLDRLTEQLHRTEELLTAILDQPPESDDSPPPHY